MSPIRVLVVEDHPMVAHGFAAVLGAAAGIEVVATAASAADGFRRIKAETPDVVVCDQNLPDGTGTGLATRLRDEAPGPAVLIVSAMPEEALIGEVVEAGCAGLVSKGRESDELVRAVQAAAAGETVLSACALRHLFLERADPAPGSRLTQRETDVLQCLAEGLSNDAIARRLYLSPHTVANHMQRMMAKLSAHSKLEALVIALRRGLVEPPRPEPAGRL